MLEKRRQLYRWQWYITYATFGFSAVAIGLAYANLTLLAQLMMIPVTLCLVAACYVAYQRYKLNSIRREEIKAHFDKERDHQLVELFDEARKKRNLPPDAQSKDGYTAAVEEAKARAAAAAAEEAARRQAGLPPGIKKRGGNK